MEWKKWNHTDLVKPILEVPAGSPSHSTASETCTPLCPWPSRPRTKSPRLCTYLACSCMINIYFGKHFFFKQYLANLEPCPKKIDFALCNELLVDKHNVGYVQGRYKLTLLIVGLWTSNNDTCSIIIVWPQLFIYFNRKVENSQLSRFWINAKANNTCLFVVIGPYYYCKPIISAFYNVPSTRKRFQLYEFSWNQQYFFQVNLLLIFLQVKNWNHFSIYFKWERLFPIHCFGCKLITKWLLLT